MPTYEYMCQACKNRWELFQPMTAKAVRKCPKCGKPKAQRLLSAGAGFLFKGNGFYTTDYRTESYKKAATAETASPTPKAADSAKPKSGKSKESKKEKAK